MSPAKNSPGVQQSDILNGKPPLVRIHVFHPHHSEPGLLEMTTSAIETICASKQLTHPPPPPHIKGDITEVFAYTNPANPPPQPPQPPHPPQPPRLSEPRPQEPPLLPILPSARNQTTKTRTDPKAPRHPLEGQRLLALLQLGAELRRPRGHGAPHRVLGQADLLVHVRQREPRSWLRSAPPLPFKGVLGRGWKPMAAATRCCFGGTPLESGPVLFETHEMQNCPVFQTTHTPHEGPCWAPQESNGHTEMLKVEYRDEESDTRVEGIKHPPHIVRFLRLGHSPQAPKSKRRLCSPAWRQGVLQRHSLGKRHGANSFRT